MTEPDTNTSIAEQRRFEARQTARREAFRLARDSGAQIVKRPMYFRDKEPTVRDVEPLAGSDGVLAGRARLGPDRRSARPKPSS